jgi:hypothetical protein
VRGSRTAFAAAPPAPSWTGDHVGASAARGRRSACRREATLSSGSVHRAQDGRWGPAERAWEPRADRFDSLDQTAMDAWAAAAGIGLRVLGSSRMHLGTTATFGLRHSVGTAIRETFETYLRGETTPPRWDRCWPRGSRRVESVKRISKAGHGLVPVV